MCKEPFYGEYPGEGIPVLDHDHETGELRDFIHKKCNVGIGHLGDSSVKCRLAAEYLEKHRRI